jgi:hypothetical protein
MSTSPCGLLECVVAIQGAAKIWGAGAEFKVERGLLKSSFLKSNFNKMLSKPISTCAPLNMWDRYTGIK